MYKFVFSKCISFTSLERAAKTYILIVISFLSCCTERPLRVCFMMSSPDMTQAHTHTSDSQPLCLSPLNGSVFCETCSQARFITVTRLFQCWRTHTHTHTLLSLFSWVVTQSSPLCLSNTREPKMSQQSVFCLWNEKNDFIVVICSLINWADNDSRNVSYFCFISENFVQICI